MPRQIKTEKWVLYRHTNDLSLTITLAKMLKASKGGSITKNNKLDLLLKLKEMGLFNERNIDLPLDSINHNINHLKHYMFGYEHKQKFLFSPLGNLYLKKLSNSEHTSKIFLTQLWAIQFNHPMSKGNTGTPESFKIYPYRLIFKLLSDKRLNYSLYAAEVMLAVVFVKSMNQNKYDNLVSKILEIRSWSDEQIRQAIDKDEHVFVNALYEWDYYVAKILKKAFVLDIHKGEAILKLSHGRTTKRTLYRTKYSINEKIKYYCHILLNTYGYDEPPIEMNDPSRMKIDAIKEAYNFYPVELLLEIEEHTEISKQAILQLPKFIDKYSYNEDGKTWSPFEEKLTEGFNMFYNVQAEWIGGPGNTDIECLYITKKVKFAVDAKSTKNKLSSLNRGRLKRHREKIGGKYTIVVTPRYTPVVLDDINESNIVIILASTFAEYLYNCIDNNIREIDYGLFHSLIENNLGKDVSAEISNITFELFGIDKKIRQAA